MASVTDDMLIRSILGPKQYYQKEFAFAGKDAFNKERRIIHQLYGKPRRWKFDYAFPDRIAWEIEGGAWTQGRHTRGKGFIDDMEKYNVAAVCGWKVIRSIPKTESRIAALEYIKRIQKHYQNLRDLGRM